MKNLIKRKLKLIHGLLMAVLIMAMTIPVTGTNYYVDATNGNDSYNGTSSSTAWQTLSKVSGFSFSPGDSILFKRGEVWRGDLDINRSGISGSPIVYGAYGEGKKPLFHQSISLNNESDWVSLGSNLWASTNEQFPGEIGFALFGEENAANVGTFLFSEEEVGKEREYWHDKTNSRVVTYCTQNPATAYSNIEISRSAGRYDHFIEGPSSGISYIHIRDLEVKYWVSHAMAFINATGIEIRNCDVSYGGGGVFYGTAARLGNGIEFWTSAKDCVVDNCRVGQCYDTGVTHQGAGTASDVSNIYFTNNILWGSDLANYEVSYSSSETTLENIHYENNISLGSGYGWAHNKRTPRDQGWDITTWAGSCGSWDGWYVKNNVFFEAGTTYYSAALYFELETPISNLEMDYNYYFKTSAFSNRTMIIDHGDRYQMEDFADYQSEKGRDLNSSTGSRVDAQNTARAKVSCENLFFLNTLFQEYDDLTLTGNAPSVFDLTSPSDKATVGNPVTLSWGTSTGSTSNLDHYEVWIDCEKVANVASGTTSYQASLSYGEHNWFVIAVCQDSVLWRQSTSNFTLNVDNISGSYLLTVESGTGSGYYEEDDVVNISPNALSGKEFAQWTGDTEYLSSPVTTSGNSVTMPASDITLTATYSDILYSLTVENGSGSGTDYIYEQVINITASASPEGQEFDRWTGDVAYVANVKDSMTTVTMPASDITVTATYKTASGDMPLFNWNIEAANVVLDEGVASMDLTNSSSVTTGGTEPNPPGYGSVGAIFNGSDQYLSLSNSDYGDRALNGTDTDGTIYVALNPDIVSNSAYFWSLYQAINGQRQLALTIENGIPIFTWGYDGGDSYQDIPVPHTFSAGEDIIVALSLNASTKEYTLLAWDVANDEYYSITDSDQELTGTYNAGSSDLVIGGRSDLSSSWFFDGTIYWVRVYDEAHSLEKMKEIIENSKEKSSTSLPSPIASTGITVYPNPAETELTINAISNFEGVPVVEIYSQTGEKVYRSSQRVSFPYRLDISSFSAGIYFIKVSDGEKKETVKIIKK